jgi:hypothetical protein
MLSVSVLTHKLRRCGLVFHWGIKAMPKKTIKLDPDDGLIVDEVGPWASAKHDRLKKYIDAYRSAALFG